MHEPYYIGSAIKCQEKSAAFSGDAGIPVFLYLIGNRKFLLWEES